MSSSSGPEAPGPGPRIDVSEVEQVEAVLEQKTVTTSERALGEAAAAAERGRGLGTLAWAAPGFVWLGFYLVAPLVFIVLVSFWTRTDFGFVKHWTTSNYTELFHDSTYWRNLRESAQTSVVAVVASLVFGFPVAYFLVFKVQNLRNQVALFIVALAPFWTSFFIRSVAWTFPLAGREGALNQFLQKIGIVDHPIAQLGFSRLSVTLALIQLYVLFMVTPLFFMLAQVDRAAMEAARDLGASWFQMFREVIVPQTMPGVVIGSIFVFVLTMGDFGTVQVIGGNAVQSVGTIVNSRFIAVEFPQAAAAAVLLVAALIVGVFVITRFSKLREEL